MKKLLVVAASIVLGIAASGRLVDAYYGETVETITVQAGGIANTPLGGSSSTQIGNGYCFSANYYSTANTVSNCTGSIDYMMGIAYAALDQQVLIKDLSCGYNKTTWDSGDTASFFVSECKATGCITVGPGLTINAASAGGAGGNTVETVAVNTLTTFTSDYVLAIKIQSVTQDTTAPNTDRLDIQCRFTYQIP